MFCPKCGRESVPGANFCSACGSSAQSPQTQLAKGKIVRPRSPRMIAGVCAGVAIHYRWDIALVRILFMVFVCLTTGLGALLYAAAWILLPDAQYALPPAPVSRQGTAI